MALPVCRLCGSELKHTFCDLGMSPLANAFLRAEDLGRAETFYPLHAYVCTSCFLVQLEQFATPEKIFGDYAYFSSYSESWLAHCEAYANRMVERFALGPRSLVMELASNDGYLLQFFKKRGVRVLGVEPAKNVAQAAIANGIDTVVRFFGMKAADELAASAGRSDLLVGNNVLAHVPDLNDFVRGFGAVLAPRGVITLEFPHLLKLIERVEFDTIYHEHFSYFSLGTVSKVLAKHGFTIFDVEEITTHGGSLRVYAQGERTAPHAAGARVAGLHESERRAGLERLETYLHFDEQTREAKRGLLAFLIAAKRAGKRIAGYGAPAKGNTLLNYCGVGRDFIDFTVDRNPTKQGRFLPGSHIPIYPPGELHERKPDYLLILPWNLKEEIVEQTQFIRDWGGRHVLAIPRVEVLG